MTFSRIFGGGGIHPSSYYSLTTIKKKWVCPTDKANIKILMDFVIKLSLKVLRISALKSNLVSMYTIGSNFTRVPRILVKRHFVKNIWSMSIGIYGKKTFG